MQGLFLLTPGAREIKSYQFFNRRTDLHRTLGAVIISHPHLDHTKNLMPVMQTFTVKNLIDGGNMRGSGFPQLKAARLFAASHHIRYRAITDKGNRLPTEQN